MTLYRFGNKTTEYKGPENGPLAPAIYTTLPSGRVMIGGKLMPGGYKVPTTNHMD